MDIGNVIYDSSLFTQVRKSILGFRLKGAAFGITFLCGGFVALFMFLGYIPIAEGAEFSQPLMMLGAIALFLLSIAALRLLIFGGKYVRVYEKGIMMPFVRMKDIFRGEKQWFISFTEIDSVFPNSNGPLDYVTIRGPEIGKKVIEKRAIDLDKLLESLKGRVRVVEETDSPYE
jgi:hypothetical protein